MLVGQLLPQMKHGCIDFKAIIRYYDSTEGVHTNSAERAPLKKIPSHTDTTLQYTKLASLYHASTSVILVSQPIKTLLTSFG